MTKIGHRAFAGFGALLFLGTSSALTIAVIITLIASNNNNASTSNNTKENTVQNNTPKLAGTKLANFTPVASIPKLEEIDTVPGTGATVKPGDTVTVDYTGAVAATGIIFQSSKDLGQTISFPLKSGPGGVISGWAEGIPGMKVGGTRRLLIPAALAYGANPPSGSGIPANADLVFDVTLHKIN